MQGSDKLREDLEKIRIQAVLAVDPFAAVLHHLELDAGRLVLGSRSWQADSLDHIYLVGIGKAACGMARAAAAVLGDRLTAGIVVARYAHPPGGGPPDGVRVFEAGHPVPDQAGVRASQAILDLLAGCAANDLLLVLISGGASALAPALVAGISLSDLQTVTAQLLHCGASINEINIVRKHLDALKGGQLARLAQPARLACLVLSDVVGDPLDSIASGPTVPDPSTFADVHRVLGEYGLLDRIPTPVLAHIQKGMRGEIAETPKPGEALFNEVENVIVGSNRQAAQQALETARSLGYNSLLLTTHLEGEARAAGKFAAAIVKSLRSQGGPAGLPACVLMGGETTVTVTGAGKGGRNQELALSAAIGIAGIDGAAVMSFATDGNDGPTDAAGAVVDGFTCRRAEALGLDPLVHLRRNDAYPLLEAAGDLLVTGPTGTNVNDLVVILVR
ncbi:MAG: glycerate kinase [Anaerolineales bacterium]|nr:glycerate kinase [Anaerolineales bacterium]